MKNKTAFIKKNYIIINFLNSCLENEYKVDSLTNLGELMREVVQINNQHNNIDILSINKKNMFLMT